MLDSEHFLRYAGPTRRPLAGGLSGALPSVARVIEVLRVGDTLPAESYAVQPPLGTRRVSSRRDGLFSTCLAVGAFLVDTKPCWGFSNSGPGCSPKRNTSRHRGVKAGHSWFDEPRLARSWCSLIPGRPCVVALRRRSSLRTACPLGGPPPRNRIRGASALSGSGPIRQRRAARRVQGRRTAWEGWAQSKRQRPLSVDAKTKSRGGRQDEAGDSDGAARYRPTSSCAPGSARSSTDTIIHARWAAPPRCPVRRRKTSCRKALKPTHNNRPAVLATRARHLRVTATSN